MTFKPMSVLEEAIKVKSIEDIRSAISTYLVTDPTDQRNEIKSAVSLVEQTEIPEVWQEHDGRNFKEKTEWDKAYFGLLQAQLMNNFSKERFAHAKEVGKYVYGRLLHKNLTTTSKNEEKEDFFTESQLQAIKVGAAVMAIVIVGWTIWTLGKK
jgi:hypothetical protein